MTPLCSVLFPNLLTLVSLTMTISAINTVVCSNLLRDAKHQISQKVRVLDVSWVRLKPGVGYHKYYLKQHIPGSVYFDLNQCSTPTKLVPFTLQDPKCLSEYIGNLGIDKETHVITYDQQDNRSALRAWWLFRYFGHSNVSLLDGGIGKWISSGFDVTSKPTTYMKCKYKCVPHPALSRDYVALQKNIKSNEEQVVDARPEEYFAEGHIPKSKNIPYSQLFREDGTFKSKNELKELFDSASVDLTKPLIGTCQLGITACGIAAAAQILGNTNTSVYTGSWHEWSQRDVLANNLSEEGKP